LPAGTVTFLFTDLEGSTRLLEAHPAAYRDAVARHHALLQEAVAAHGGAVFETVGDAAYAAFARPTAAVAAALAGQLALHRESWGETGPLRARMGVHLGEVERQGAHYFGAPLYRCARLTATAHGGQTVLSEAVAAVVRDALPAGAGLTDLGEQRLRDLQRPERVFQLGHPALPAAFPPLRSLDALPNNLPLQVTSFVGRERELGEVAALLGAHRLVTLTGPGGTGKTRLALQAAADALEVHPDGVWLAELGALADPALVPQAVAAAVGVREEPGRPLPATLADALRPKRLLLVLDNCEHLLEACARLADAVLRACPHVRLLCTSREALGIAGETVWRVPSLPVPAGAGAAGAPSPAAPTAGDVARSAAVRLFCDRAAAVQPGFALTADNAAAVGQVCIRLDGIPLALELAAARVRVLPPRQLLARLEDRFRLLTGGSRTALERHQTLQAAVDWSHDLLTASERALFARLAVFAGGFTLEAAETVGAGPDGPEGPGGAGIEAPEVLDLLTRLVDKSLVVADEQPDGTARYRLLETLRQYAQQKLAAGAAGALRERHARYYLDLAEAAEPALWGPEQAARFERLEAELGNLRAALAWWVAHDTARGLRLATALGRLWLVRGLTEEGRRWLHDLLAPDVTGAASTDAAGAGAAGAGAAGAGAAGAGAAGTQTASEAPAVALRARALTWAARLAAQGGRIAAARRLAEGSLGLYQRLGEAGEAHGHAWALAVLAGVAIHDGRLDEAATLVEDCLSLARRHGHEDVATSALLSRGHIAVDRGDPAAAREHYAAVVARWRRLGDGTGMASALHALGMAALAQGDVDTAEARFEESLAAARAVGGRGGVGTALASLGWVAEARGDPDSARERYAEALGLFRDLGARLRYVDVLVTLAGLALDAGQTGEARRNVREALDDVRVRMAEAGESRLRLFEFGVAEVLHALACLAAIDRQPERALRLAAAAVAVHPAWRADWWSAWGHHPLVGRADRWLAVAREALDQPSQDAAWANGQAMTLEQAVAYALEEAPAGA
jgi:predicted ATPase/class 3 adenylate cyclase